MTNAYIKKLWKEIPAYMKLYIVGSTMLTLGIAETIPQVLVLGGSFTLLSILIRLIAMDED